MINVRTVTDARTGDVAVQAYTVRPDGTLLMAERVLRYIDVETPDRAKVVQAERNKARAALQEVIDAGR